MNNFTLKVSSESSRAFLDAVYQQLGYRDGALFDAMAIPTESQSDVWLEKGDWLALAKKVNAEKIFFVNNDPVIVFCQLENNDAQTLVDTFRQVWCMSRPQCLFIASPGQLKVYTLNRHPVQTIDEWEQIPPLEIVTQIAEVSEKLQAYRREQVESGQLFTEKDFGASEQRADKRLIQDLKLIRQALLDEEPRIKQSYVHALIGRSIFVRYLEDRGVLIPEYFRRVAENRNHPNWTSKWIEILETPEERDISPDTNKRLYSRVLQNKDFTYALFNQLAEHFNGDMFPRDQGEEKAVTKEHLELLRKFLLGDTDPQKPRLFLWAYDFEIIPIELISSIYEEFYHKSSGKDKGTHYTPSVLVEYMLTQLLTPERLATKPKILDFACGSAIFLVQAFRRIVRYQEALQKEPLKSKELRQILLKQLTGIEINEEAIHVAAFSLYLALLHYQEPKDILAQIEQANDEKPLPYLIYDTEQPMDDAHYRVLFRANAFSLMHSEKEYIKKYLDKHISFSGKAEYQRLLDTRETLPFEQNTFDVIVGNPPWGYLKKNEGTPELRMAQEHTLRWCDVFGWSIGDKELSQAFMARASALLKHGGECGLLVSTGVLLKRAKQSQLFRQRWLKESTVKKVVNFTHVRTVFFSEAISPFCFIQYKLSRPTSTQRLQYWSAKKTEVVDNAQGVILSLPDIHQVRQSELVNNDSLWKVYWWGSHRDAAVINGLQLDPTLQELAQEREWPEPSRGFQGYRQSAENYPSEWLLKYKELPIDSFQRYGTISDGDLVEVPNLVHRRGSPDIYDGWRILFKRGITQAEGTDGRIEARLEDKSFCFRNSIHGIRVDNSEIWERKVLIGILWSSLARYYFFMTSSSWGTWHHEIHLQDGLLSLPIRLPNNEEQRNRIIKIVDDLRNWNPTQIDLLNQNGLSLVQIKQRRQSLEQDLDAAIFELYELNEAEQDLVLDLCEVGLEFFYRNANSRATLKVVNYPTLQGTIVDLPANRNKEVGLEGYLYAFLQIWNRELESSGGEFRWRIIRSPHAPMLAVVFTTQHVDEKFSKIENNYQTEWQYLLQRLDATLRQPVSPRIYIDGMVRAVTDTDIFIIKRDECRLWTRSMAREDAEATLLQAILIQESGRRSQ